jgi:hypothetical protein
METTIIKTEMIADRHIVAVVEKAVPGPGKIGMREGIEDLLMKIETIKAEVLTEAEIALANTTRAVEIITTINPIEKEAVTDLSRDSEADLVAGIGILLLIGEILQAATSPQIITETIMTETRTAGQAINHAMI